MSSKKTKKNNPKVTCPICGAYKKPWFDTCYNCSDYKKTKEEVLPAEDTPND